MSPRTSPRAGRRPAALPATKQSATPTPRQMMELAVEQMRLSKSEVKPGGKPKPLVGAAILLANGTVAAAYRSEVRNGDHAEFTLFERKHHGVALDGASLFVTLEPCAPGARSSEKTPCCQRVVDARIKDIWIGIEDPWPTVAGQGQQYLEENGVTIHAFERDLQEQILQVNQEFIDYALETAAKSKANQPAPQTSPLESPASASLDELASSALNFYRHRLGLKGAIDTPEFRRFLWREGLISGPGADAQPTWYGLILLGDRPRRRLNQAGLQATVRFADGTEASRTFDTAAILIPDQLERWLKGKVPTADRRDRMRRGRLPRLPFEAIREAVINALVHRDYADESARCQILVTDDEIEVRSPGGPIPPVSLADLKRLDATVHGRNHRMLYVFHRLRLIEEAGNGMRTFRALPDLGYPQPTYAMKGGYLTLTFYRRPDAMVEKLALTAPRPLTSEEKTGLAYIATDGPVRTNDYARHVRVSARTAARQLSDLVSFNLVEVIGSGPSTRYQIHRS